MCKTNHLVLIAKRGEEMGQMNVGLFSHESSHQMDKGKQIQRMSRSSTMRRMAFTLIELLVVIAIIALGHKIHGRRF